MQLLSLKEEVAHMISDMPDNKQAVYYIDFIRQCLVITDIVDIK